MKYEIINLFGHIINALENNLNYNKMKLIKNKKNTIKYLKLLNYPVTLQLKSNEIKTSDYIVCKPIEGSCGKGIKFFLPGEEIKDEYLDDKKYVYEMFVSGNNYRIILYKNKVVSIFKRSEPFITGDGINSIKNIVDKINNNRIKKNKIVLDTKDENIILEKNKKFKCNKLSNFSTGGSVESINIKTIPTNTIKLFENLSKDINLNLFSIDLIATDLTIDYKNQPSFNINELEYFNDWDVNFILKDNFYKLAIFLLIKWILFFIFFVIFLKYILL